MGDGRELALYVGVPLTLTVAGAAAAPYFFRGVSGGAARGVKTSIWGAGEVAPLRLMVAQGLSASNVPPVSGSPPPAGSTGTFAASWTAKLEVSATGVGVPGATLTWTVTSDSTTVTSGSGTTDGTGSVAINLATTTLVAGTTYTLNVNFAGATISGVYYEPSTASSTFTTGSGTPTTIVLTYTGS